MFFVTENALRFLYCIGLTCETYLNHKIFNVKEARSQTFLIT